MQFGYIYMQYPGWNALDCHSRPKNLFELFRSEIKTTLFLIIILIDLDLYNILLACCILVSLIVVAYCITKYNCTLHTLIHSFG